MTSCRATYAHSRAQNSTVITNAHEAGFGSCQKIFGTCSDRAADIVGPSTSHPSCNYSTNQHESRSATAVLRHQQNSKCVHGTPASATRQATVIGRQDVRTLYIIMKQEHYATLPFHETEPCSFGYRAYRGERHVKRTKCSSPVRFFTRAEVQKSRIDEPMRYFHGTVQPSHLRKGGQRTERNSLGGAKRRRERL